jgi:hypothetical protein
MNVSAADNRSGASDSEDSTTAAVAVWPKQSKAAKRRQVIIYESPLGYLQTTSNVEEAVFVVAIATNFQECARVGDVHLTEDGKGLIRKHDLQTEIA